MDRRASTAAPRRFRMPRGRPLLWPSVLAALVAVIVSAGAAAAIETETVSSFWEGLWWSISLITTVGFIGAPLRSPGGAALSVVLMAAGSAGASPADDAPADAGHRLPLGDGRPGG